jgi:hypothetical protein
MILSKMATSQNMGSFFLLICNAASVGNLILMFQCTVVVSPLRVEISEKSDVVSLPRRTETSITLQQKTINSEEKTS